jgi:prophage regulatory protein
MSNAILRLPATLAGNGHSRSTHYLRMKQGLWTKPVRIGSRARGWPARECEAINAARIAGKSDEEIRALVKKLEAARTSDKGVRP